MSETKQLGVFLIVLTIALLGILALSEYGDPSWFHPGEPPDVIFWPQDQPPLEDWDWPEQDTPTPPSFQA